jgi:cyclopropane fatty-acyl-phospholipid synthase-like methyltransferase
LHFQWTYLVGQTPWDTNITPPELVELIEREGFGPGRALDLGCGTGTNAIYLARHGWRVTGIDFVARAVETARRKAQAANVHAEFRCADVLVPGRVDGPFDLILDIGCLHSLSADGRARYADNTRHWTHPGSILLVYAFFPIVRGGRKIGLPRAEMEKLFTPDYNLVSFMDDGQSAWYRWQRH